MKRRSPKVAPAARKPVCCEYSSRRHGPSSGNMVNSLLPACRASYEWYPLNSFYWRCIVARRMTEYSVTTRQKLRKTFSPCRVRHRAPNCSFQADQQRSMAPESRVAQQRLGEMLYMVK